jgi:hypothetical protein
VPARGVRHCHIRKGSSSSMPTVVSRRRPDRDVHRKVQHVPAPLWICEWGRRRGGGGLKKAIVGLRRRGVPQIGEDVRGVDHSGVAIRCPSGGVHPTARCGIDPERRNSGGRRHPHEAMRRRRRQCGPGDVREARQCQFLWR